MANTHRKGLSQSCGHRSLPVLIAAIALPRAAARSCFSEPESRNSNWLRLISFRHAHARARASPRAFAVRVNPREAPRQWA
jgi:hypothetical protein